MIPVWIQPGNHVPFWCCARRACEAMRESFRAGAPRLGPGHPSDVSNSREIGVRSLRALRTKRLPTWRVSVRLNKKDSPIANRRQHKTKRKADTHPVPSAMGGALWRPARKSPALAGRMPQRQFLICDLGCLASIVWGSVHVLLGGDCCVNDPSLMAQIWVRYFPWDRLALSRFGAAPTEMLTGQNQSQNSAAHVLFGGKFSPTRRKRRLKADLARKGQNWWKLRPNWPMPPEFGRSCSKLTVVAPEWAENAKRRSSSP